MSPFIYFVTFLIHLNNVNTANILGLFPHTGKSHHMVFEPLLLKLAERGHNMTVASFFPQKKVKNPPPNYHDISFQGMYEARLDAFDLNHFEDPRLLYRIPKLGSIARQVLQLQPFAIASAKICEKVSNFRPLSDALMAKYDVVILENFVSDCMLGLLHVYGINAPIVYILSGNLMPWSAERVGADENPSYVPLITATFSSHMTLWERIENTVINIIFKYWHYNQVQLREKEALEKKFGNIPDLRELGKKTSLILVNSYHTLNGVIPLVPGMVQVGGLHLDSSKQLIPQFIEKFLNESSDGVILFSFGSNIKTKSLPKYKEQILVTALSKLKQRVIWKYEDSGEEGMLEGNILKVNWLPQYKLLLHKKVIAFISHGGMLGMTEATAAGKPMITIPIFGDQLSNAAAASEAGIGIILSYENLTEKTLNNALKAVTSDEMSMRAQLVSKIWHDRESSPLDTAVFWTEHVIRWGNTSRLHSAARNLSFIQLSLLDVAAILIITLFLITMPAVYLILKILKKMKKINFRSIKAKLS